MTYAAWEARMSTPDKSGSTPRDSWRVLARKGRADALAMLEGPPFPDALGYLWGWCLELRRGLGVGMEGLASLTWPALDAWCRLTRRDPAPHEVDALFDLDRVLRHPESMDAPTEAMNA